MLVALVITQFEREPSALFLSRSKLLCRILELFLFVRCAF